MLIESIMRALADQTRLRILQLLGTMELAVGELAQVLGQSQPRVSRHIAILCDAGLARRRREGSWVFLRACAGAHEGSGLADAVAALLASAEEEDEVFARQCADDRRQLAAIRKAREAGAAQWFADNAGQWDELRRMHSPDDKVEDALAQALGNHRIGRLLDIGTGTGRMAEIFAASADHIVALDKSLEMLKVARAKLQHLPAERVELVQGDFQSLPFAADHFDTVLLHQVLHFAHDPALALGEAARVLQPAGRIAIVDFAAHTHEDLREKFQHVRLGFEDAAMRDLLKEAGFMAAKPIALEGGALVVKVWLGHLAGPSPAASPAPIPEETAR